jgi:serine/threonine-protein kinase
MLLDEGHISMSLQHSNIVQVLDLGVAGNRYFLVMELVDGWDLEKILQRAYGAGMVFPPALSLHVIAVVCRALAYAHAKTRGGKPLGIVHRDLSPNNVLISEQGEIKLADFGIAKAQRKREQTAAGVIKGKVAYMSPEQASGATIDKRSDIFSVGSVLYRMMTERLPFEAASDLEQLLKVQKGEFTPPREAKKGVNEAVAKIIMRAMRLAPSERYQTADEMLVDVERVLRSEFQSAGQTELKQWLEQLGRRDKVDSIGKHRVDTSGVVKDMMGTDLSAGTSFELDEVDIITTGATELSGRPPPTPPPLVVGAASSRPETVVDRSPRGAAGSVPTPPPVTAAVGLPRKRGGGFWFGVAFAIAALLGGRYLIGWAEQQGYLARFGIGAPPEAPVQGPPAPEPEAKPEPPPAPAPVVATPSPPAPAVADAAAPVVAAAKDAAPATPDATAVAAADDDQDEEALLKKAVPNAEQAVIGADGAENEKDDKGGEEREPPETAPAGEKPARAPVAAKPKPVHETAILHITTTPVGAIVRTKGQVLGRTPINLHFRTGNKYELTFVKNGYVSASRLVDVPNTKDKKVALSLKKKPAPRKRSFFHPHR